MRGSGGLTGGFYRGITDEISRRVGVFSVIGLGNAVVDLGTLSVLAWLMPTGSSAVLILYNTLGLALANTNSYLWNSRWTFRGDREAGTRQRRRFIFQAALNVCISNALLWGAVAFLLAHTTLSMTSGENVAKLFSALVASGVSFILMRRFVFVRPTEMLNTLPR